MCWNITRSISFFFFFNDTATTEIYTLSLHDALPLLVPRPPRPTMPTLTLSFAPHTRTADAAVRAPRKNLRVFGSDNAKLLFASLYQVTGWTRSGATILGLQNSVHPLQCRDQRHARRERQN